MAADRAGVVADVCAVAQPDREAVALAASGCAEDAPPGGGLAAVAGPGASILGPVCHGLTRTAPLCGAVGRGKTGPSLAFSAVITDFESQNSLGVSPPEAVDSFGLTVIRLLH